MSNLPDNELDLEKLFLPAWAQEEPSSAKYAKYEMSEERPDRFGDRRNRPPRRDFPPGGRREEGGRPPGARRGPRPEGGHPAGGRPRGGRPGQEGREGRPGDRREMRERREPPAPLPEVNVSIVPEEKGVDSLARQIRMSGRAYPLFDIAQMILQKPERHNMTFSVKKNAEGQPVQRLFVCALDETLWLNEDEAVAHVLKRHFGTFYQAERTATEPPKGKYTFVAQCGFSGVILGPPNHHDYQTQLHRLHSERFSRMPFEAYKARVRIVRDEEVVKKWVEDQSFRTEYICLNLPEPPRLGNMEAVEKHFRETHKENIVKEVELQTLTGVAARNLRSPELGRLARSAWEDQRRFPLQTATVLSQQFASRGLQFFKVNKTVTHVCVARPHYLDLEAAPVSDGVRKIVDYINSHPKCNRRQLVESLSPTPAVVAPTPAPTPAPAEPEAEAAAAVAPTPAAPATSSAPAMPAAPSPTPEQTAVIADLHWLIHQGHVIEFANGVLETAKKPLPKPPKPEPKPKATEAAAPAAAASTSDAPAAAEPAPPAEAADGTVPTSEVVGEAPAQESPAGAVTPPEPVADTPPAPVTPPTETASAAPPAEPTLPT
jgi:hypothetical protein